MTTEPGVDGDLAAQLRDARAEIERLKERERALIRAKDGDLDDARSEIVALRKEVAEANKAYDGAEYARELMWAELAAERAKVQRVETFLTDAERGDKGRSRVVYCAGVRAALAGGETDE